MVQTGRKLGKRWMRRHAAHEIGLGKLRLSSHVRGCCTLALFVGEHTSFVVADDDDQANEESVGCDAGDGVSAGWMVLSTQLC